MKKLLNRSIKPFHRDMFINSIPVDVPEVVVIDKAKKEKEDDAATD